jgi:glycosyltransferase involved in cell wall biosynthesis
MLAYLDTSIPVIYATDASFQQLQGYYPGFSNLPKYNIRQGIGLDKQAFRRSAHCMLASEWCSRSVRDDYRVDADRISVVPFGANLDGVPERSALQFDASGKCRLLFLAVEWERKGGDIVLDAFRILQQKGLKPQLRIIGCIPPRDITNDPDITVIPFLDKNKKEEMDRLHGIFLDTDLLFLPTRAECAGVVFSEASAYGIPSVTTDTGGVGTYVREAINGYALPSQAGAQDYAETIESIVLQPGRMAALKVQSRTFYERELSWERWGGRFSEIAEKLAGGTNFKQAHGGNQ